MSSFYECFIFVDNRTNILYTPTFFLNRIQVLK